MLVLSRKQMESLSIGDSIEITVLEVRKGRVRLGISAPRTVSVMRLELQQRVHLPARDNGRTVRCGSSITGTREVGARLEQGLQYSIPNVV